VKWLVMAVLLGAASCAPAIFHGGRTSLAPAERTYLAPREGATSGIFSRFWQAPGSPSWGLIHWDENKSFTVREAPRELLQAIRDEVGRLNQEARAGEDSTLAVTVYRFTKGGFWNPPTAYCELVARDVRGQVVWAVDDMIEAAPRLARTLADPPSAIIAREILRKLRRQLRL
jgi:hypothetical protein